MFNIHYYMQGDTTPRRFTQRKWTVPWIVVIACYNQRILRSKATITDGHASWYVPVSFTDSEHHVSISSRRPQTSLSFIPPTTYQQKHRRLRFCSDKTEARCDTKMNANDNHHATATTSYQIDNGTIYRFRGIVETGFGRGGKKLGFPTANLGPSTFFDTALMNISTGVYFGSALIEFPDGNDNHNNNDDDTTTNTTDATHSNRNIIYKTVVNIGYSPTFVGNENKMKIIEAHLLLPPPSETATFMDFYNTTIRLQLLGYLRPEMKFASLPDLIQQITNDIDTAHQLFMEHPYNNTQWVQDSFFVLNQEQPWIGTSGGNSTASYEILPAMMTM